MGKISADDMARRQPALLYLRHDGEDAPRLRAEHLAEHLDWVARHAADHLLAGPRLDAEAYVYGSVMVLRTGDADATHALFEADPYRFAGVWLEVDRITTTAVAGTRIGGISWPRPAAIHPSSDRSNTV